MTSSAESSAEAGTEREPETGQQVSAGQHVSAELKIGAERHAGTEQETGNERQIGVGPHPHPWPTDPRYDPELLAHGDRRNVIDCFRYWKRDAIIEELAIRRHDLHVAIENFEHDFNIGSVVRTANAFNVGAVHIVGARRWNRRGAMVTDRYQDVRHHPTVPEFLQWARAEDRYVIAVDNVPGCVAIEHAEIPEHAVMIFGQEGPGLSADALAGADLVVAIPQYGSTRSMNAGAAAAIAMHEWIRRHADIPCVP
ncbi:TrmH family RNA methyltransferase [Devriesea agamarum]|uniref:TrmH family RNA methyltransferase n=1 Tax=Devriesea agamarum TaxID=472569 RepID=UPI00071C56C4|nr:TrmH family RNA methyltransferase [Devriesea agamarum]